MSIMYVYLDSLWFRTCTDDISYTLLCQMSARMSTKTQYLSESRPVVIKARIILLQSLLKSMLPSKMKSIYTTGPLKRASTQTVSTRLTRNASFTNRMTSTTEKSRLGQSQAFQLSTNRSVYTKLSFRQRIPPFKTLSKKLPYSSHATIHSRQQSPRHRSTVMMPKRRRERRARTLLRLRW